MLDGTLSAGLSAPAIRAFTAVRLELPGSIVNVIDGNSAVTFNVNGTPVTFTGRDPIFGAVSYIGALSEQVAQESPTFSFGLMPSTDSAIATLCAPQNQGSSIRVWFGLFNDVTGATIGQPEMLWSGRMDTASVTSATESQFVEIESVSAFDRLFAAEENARLNGVHHRSIWPNETGLDFVISGMKNPVWGIDGGGGGGSTVQPFGLDWDRVRRESEAR